MGETRKGLYEKALNIRRYLAGSDAPRVVRNAFAEIGK